MSLQSVGGICFGFLAGKRVEVEASRAELTSDAGLLPIRQFDGQWKFTEQFAAAISETRQEESVEHTRLSMCRQRIYGLLADYADQNDHDSLRKDPVFKLVCDRSPDGADLASQPTLSRFENGVQIADLRRLRDVLVDQFVASFAEPPLRLTLDFDAFDDPTHGQQQLTFFHGHYEQYQYLPLAVTCAENDAVLLVGLRHGTASAFLGADDDVRYLAQRLRAAWPDVQLHVRGDCGFGVPLMYAVCEELRLTYTFGLAMNPRLKAASESLLAQAVSQYAASGEKQRLFLAEEYQAGTWPFTRQVVIKCEAHAQGTNRRAVVTNRAGWSVSPEAVYDAYTERGESENRNKELKRELMADRLSDHRFVANFFRLYLHAAALNLLVRLRRATSLGVTPADVGVFSDVPAEALPEGPRKRWFNGRRQADPLGEGFACTWRTRLIKVAAEVVVSARRVLVRLSASWPYFDDYERISRTLLGLTPAPGTS